MKNDFDADSPLEARVDLSPLDPLADAAEFERTLDRIRSRVEPLLAARRPAPDVWSVIADWRRPILVASGVLAFVGAMVLLPLGRRSNDAGSLAEAAGFRGSIAEWVESGRVPSSADIIVWEATQ